MNLRCCHQRVPIHDPATIFANRTVNLDCEHPSHRFAERTSGMFKQSGWAILALAILAGAAPAVQGRERVAFEGGVQPGTIVIKTSERRLYLALGGRQRHPLSRRCWSARKTMVRLGLDRRQVHAPGLVAAG
jgi:hypothetical protein